VGLGQPQAGEGEEGAQHGAHHGQPHAEGQLGHGEPAGSRSAGLRGAQWVRTQPAPSCPHAWDSRPVPALILQEWLQVVDHASQAWGERGERNRVGPQVWKPALTPPRAFGSQRGPHQRWPGLVPGIRTTFVSIYLFIFAMLGMEPQPCAPPHTQGIGPSRRALTTELQPEICNATFCPSYARLFS
jgi:hypothetical protein